MTEVKWTCLFLFVFVSLTMSCQSSRSAAGQEITPGENTTNHLPATFGFLNSTNMTNFATGITANVIAVLLYGSNFVPLKKVDTGDGMFFQWVNCAAIWAVSVIGNVILHSPKFQPVAMTGGILWATANMSAVLIIRTIGLGLATLLWGSTSLLAGWATTRFGLFGIGAEEVSQPILNYCGAALCLLSGLLFFFVKTDMHVRQSSELTPLLIDRRGFSGSYGPSSSELWIDTVEPRTRRIIGCLLAVGSGMLYGAAYMPVLYIKSQSTHHDSMFHGASLYDPNYVYALSAGIFLTSTIYFIIYCAVMKNKPRIYPRAVLPGILSGSMWSLATYSWFLASNYLSAVITFPIVSAGYGLVAALWGSLVFKEVKGVVNCSLFILASCIVLTGSVLTAISKI